MATAQSACEAIEKHKQDIKLQIEKEKNSPGAFFNNLIDNFSIGGILDKASAKNEAESTVLQILQNNISQKKSLEIQQSCNQGSVSSQTNEINNLQCAVCNGGVIYDKSGKVVGTLPAENLKISKYGKDGKDSCVIQDVVQRNQSDVKKECVMTSMISALMEAQADTQAHAVAKLMQEASGLMSKNQNQASSCTDIKQNLSQEDYLKAISECAQQSTSSQSNALNYCGKAINVLQENIQEATNDCIISNTMKAEAVAKAKTEAETEIETSQKAEGLNLFASLASLGVFLIPMIVCIIIICSSSLASSVFVMLSSSKKSSTDSMGMGSNSLEPGSFGPSPFGPGSFWPGSFGPGSFQGFRK